MSRGRPPSIEEKEAVSVDDLLALPDAPRKTYLALVDVGGEAHPNEITSITGRHRAMENLYLNKLYLLGFTQKIKKGRMVYFKAIQRAKKQEL